MTLDEAQVLIQNALQNEKNTSSQGLNQQEFENFIFSGDDTVNINLKNLKPLSPIKPASKNSRTIEPKSCHQTEEEKQQKEWKFYMQKCVKTLTNDLCRNQEFQNNKVDKKLLLKVIKCNAQISEDLKAVGQNSLNAYLDQFYDEECNKLDYGKMIQNLTEFDYVQSLRDDDNIPRSNYSQRTGLTDAVSWNEPKTIFDDDYIVLDQKKVPQNMIEQIEAKTIKINRKLVKKFGTTDNLKKQINEQITSDANGNVSVDQLRDFVLGICEEDLINRKIFKRDIEGFLSAFNYNTYGATNINSISGLVFTRDDLIQDKLAERKRANPPPVDLNKDIPATEDDPHNKRIRTLLNQMEDKVFDGKVKLYQVFKKFDKDQDGFVSYDDFEKCLKAIKVDASKNEIGQMLKLIDHKNQGYLSFHDFSKVFRPDMSTVLTTIPENDRYFNNNQPNRETTKDNTSNQKKFTETIGSLRTTFQPEQDPGKYFFLFHLLTFFFIFLSELIAPTRFSSKPVFESTFSNFQHGKNAPGHIDEKSRLARPQPMSSTH